MSPFSRHALTDEDLPAALLLVLFAIATSLTPAQADTFYHLRAGSVMWESGALLTREVFSFTTFGAAHPNHWWLAQLAFYGLHSVGGPALTSIVSGACAFLAVLSTWLLTRGARSDVRLILLLVLALTLPQWSVRPQVFSLLLGAVTARLILTDRLAWLPPLIMLWANVHAVVVLGVILAFVPVVEAVLWSRRRLKRTLFVALACAAAPTVSPLGLGYWPYVLRTVRDARSLGLDEYRAAIHLDAATIGLWLVIVALASVAVRAMFSLGTRQRGDRLLLVSSVVLAASAVASVRNAGFFVLVAVPALARFMPPAPARRSRPAPAPAYVFVAVMAVVAGSFAWSKWRDGGAAVGWKPFSAEAVEAIRACPEPMFNSFYAGGALIWFVPERRVFVDGRTDAYPVAFLERVGHAERDGDYQGLFADYIVQCAVVEADSRLARNLSTDASMKLQFSDPAWAVFWKRPPPE